MICGWWLFVLVVWLLLDCFCGYSGSSSFWDMKKYVILLGFCGSVLCGIYGVGFGVREGFWFWIYEWSDLVGRLYWFCVIFWFIDCGGFGRVCVVVNECVGIFDRVWIDE